MISSEDRILTNQLLIEDLELEEEFTEKSLRDNIQLMKYYRLLSQQINDTLQASVNWIDSAEAKEFFFNEAYYQQEIWQSLDDEWDTILSGKYETIDGLLQEIYDYGKAKGYKNIAEHLRYTDTDRLAFAFARNYNYGLIQKLDDDLRGAIKNRLTQAAIQGENPLSLAPKIYKLGLTQLPGSTFTPRQRATMIARTEISRIQNTGILQSYVNEGYTEVKLLTAEDNNVCALCLRYAYEFNKDDKLIFENHGEEIIHNIRDLIKGGEYPPFHPHCRCTYLSVWESKVKPSENVPFTVNLTPLTDYDDAFIPDIPNKIPHESLNSFEELFNQTPDIYDEYYEKIGANLTRLKENVKTYDFGKLKLSFEDGAQLTYDEVISHLKNLPQKFYESNANRIVFTKQSATNASGVYLPTKEGIDNDIHIYYQDNSNEEILNVLNHELAHSIDLTVDDKRKTIRSYSDPEIYEKIFKADNQHNAYTNVNGKKRVPKVFPTEYAGKSWKKYKSGKLQGISSEGIKEQRFEEDFADSTKLYLDPKQHNTFVTKFPNRAEYLETIYGKVSF